MTNKQMKFADDGWALWIDGDDRSTIYLNEWINPKGKNYVDVSIRIYGCKAVKKVNFFSPFRIDVSEITDLSHMLSDIRVLRSLFNTNGIVDKEKNEYISELKYDNRTLNLVSLSKEYVNTEDIANGTIITVDFEFLKDYVSSDEAYIIFRIPHKTLDEIFEYSIDVRKFFDRVNSLVQSPIVSKAYGYSIRINEARLLPHELNRIEVLQQQRIRKALVTISIDEEYEMNDSSCHRIRRLEEELNRNYAPEGYDCSRAITYQWIEERDSNMKAHYNFYFTMRHSVVSRLSMLFYLIILFFCGALGSALYDFVKFLFNRF